MFCSNCGSSLRDGVKFCPYCGQKVRIPDPIPTPVTDSVPAPEPIPAAVPADPGPRLMHSRTFADETPSPRREENGSSLFRQASFGEPKTEAPAPEPVIEEPVVPATPVFEEPAAPEPVFEEPAAPEPVIEEPAAPEPVFEEPAAPEPVFEEPAAPEPVFEEPAASEPVMEAPAPDMPVFAERTAPDMPVFEEPEVPVYGSTPAEANDMPAFMAEEPAAAQTPAPKAERHKKQRKGPANDEPVDEPAFLPVKEPEVPAENRPLSPWAYFGYGLLFSIPVIGLILLIVLSFAPKNINLKNFARSYWCGLALVVVFVLIVLVLILTGVLTGPIETGLNWLKDTGFGWLLGKLAA